MTAFADDIQLTLEREAEVSVRYAECLSVSHAAVICGSRSEKCRQQDYKPCDWRRPESPMGTTDHFRTNQGHCASCRKKWALQQPTCALEANAKRSLTHCQQLPTDQAGGWAAATALSR